MSEQTMRVDSGLGPDVDDDPGLPDDDLPPGGELFGDDDPDDDDPDAPAGGGVFLPKNDPTRMSVSPLDELRDMVTQTVRREDIVLPVTTRPGMSIRFDVNIDMERVQHFRKRSENKRRKDEHDPLKYSCLLIANQAVAFLLRGQEVPGRDGEPISFRSREVLAWTGAHDVPGAVRALFSSDGHLLAVSNELMRAAGYTGDVESGDDFEEDPTSRS